MACWRTHRAKSTPRWWLSNSTSSLHILILFHPLRLPLLFLLDRDSEKYVIFLFIIFSFSSLTTRNKMKLWFYSYFDFANWFNWVETIKYLEVKRAFTNPLGRPSNYKVENVFEYEMSPSSSHTLYTWFQDGSRIFKTVVTLAELGLWG